MKDKKSNDIDELATLGMHAGASPIIFRNAEKLREKMTYEEAKLWQLLKHRPYGFKFRRQHPFGGYILDFYCHASKLSIELDGPNHDDKGQKEYDARRTMFINELGVKELRFKNEEIRNSVDNVFKEIKAFLKKK